LAAVPGAGEPNHRGGRGWGPAVQHALRVRAAAPPAARGSPLAPPAPRAAGSRHSPPRAPGRSAGRCRATAPLPRGWTAPAGGSPKGPRPPAQRRPSAMNASSRATRVTCVALGWNLYAGPHVPSSVRSSALATGCFGGAEGGMGVRPCQELSNQQRRAVGHVGRTPFQLQRAREGTWRERLQRRRAVRGRRKV
jgi:hypothetical protein